MEKYKSQVWLVRVLGLHSAGLESLFSRWSERSSLERDKGRPFWYSSDALKDQVFGQMLYCAQFFQQGQRVSVNIRVH